MPKLCPPRADGAAGDQHDLLAGPGQLDDLFGEVAQMRVVHRPLGRGDDRGAELDDDASGVLRPARARG